MVYVRVSGRVELQVSGLSGLGAVGNYNQVATAVVNKDGKIYEVPVLTGNALKHWHAYYTAEAYVNMGGKHLNDLCKLGIGFRGYNVNTKIGGNFAWSKDECEAVLDLCNDLHGFLITQGGRSDKRDSLVKAAFVVPVLESNNLEAVSKFAVQHNRVVPDAVREKAGERQAMMPYKQEYATGLYGFDVRMDLDYTLTPMFTDCKVNLPDLDSEKRLRMKAAVAALIPLLVGSGSKQARALPIVEVKEVVAVVSEKPIPNLVHGAYPGYCQKSLDILKAYLRAVGGKAQMYSYGTSCGGGQSGEVAVERVDSLEDLFNRLLSIVEGGQTSPGAGRQKGR
ncbi:MAG: type I-A CRISPR-associated protein Cas7/Csa2 [Pyrobaculum sp.]